MTTPEYQPRHQQPETEAERQFGVEPEKQRAVPLDPERLPPRPGIWVATDVESFYGTWWDATGSPEVLRQRIGDGFIFDSLGFGDFVLDPDEDPAIVAAVAGGIAEHGPAFAAWAQLHDADTDLLAVFGDHYLGQFASFAELGLQLLSSTGWNPDQLPEPLRRWVHVDYDAIGRAEIDTSRLLAIPSEGGGIYLFLGPAEE